MKLKMVTSMIAAAALVAAPTVAAAAPYAPVAAERAGADAGDANELVGRGGGVSTFALAAGLLILIAIIALAVTDNDEPVSP